MPQRLIKSLTADKDTLQLVKRKLEREARKFDDAIKRNAELRERWEREGGAIGVDETPTLESVEEAWRDNARRLRDFASQL